MMKIVGDDDSASRYLGTIHELLVRKTRENYKLYIEIYSLKGVLI